MISALSPATERRIFKPAQLNALARDLLESNFSQIWLEGEISNLSRPASGHLYFSLKDASAQVRCAMFRNRAMLLSAPIKDGQLVLVRARVTLYEARGEYQLSVESIEPAGQGALQLAYERLKAKLDAEGLFATDRKRPLPRWLKRLGLITSPRGAAVHDVLSVLERRFPLLPVELWPVPVQGAEAAAEIRIALQAALASGRYDAILITRGGGSLEDLWPFNDEALVRLVASAPIPVISAIGHEVDFSLLDFAADLRAPTPSAAAELLSPDAGELQRRLNLLAQKLQQAMRGRLQSAAQRNDTALLRLQAVRPAQRLHNGSQQLQALRVRLQHAMQQRLLSPAQRLRLATHRLDRAGPQNRIALQRAGITALQQSLHRNLQRQLDRRIDRLKQAGIGLNALSPLATLARGYSILRDHDSRVILRPQQVRPGQSLNAQLSEGRLRLRVDPDE
ncbi:exodeoxyribonuclease VII large subunit [Arenimonas sp.]|uniref:exodeoxyribonuclease VII large subunit n=1 Tax=Arenimonas sp. TaxID=1872635 RepID=UPI0037BE8E54